MTFSGSLFLLAVAVQTMPIGTAYAMFVGIGAVGAAGLGIVLFGEPTHATRIFFLTMLSVSLIGLRLTSVKALPFRRRALPIRRETSSVVWMVAP